MGYNKTFYSKFKFANLTVLEVCKMVLSNLNIVLQFNLVVIKYKWYNSFKSTDPYYIDLTKCKNYVRYSKIYKLLYRI